MLLNKRIYPSLTVFHRLKVFYSIGVNKALYIHLQTHH